MRGLTVRWESRTPCAGRWRTARCNFGSCRLDARRLRCGYLQQRGDPLFILSSGRYTGFDYVVRVDGQNVRLITDPEDLVFQEL